MTFSRSTRLAVTGLAFLALTSLVDAACPNGCSEKGVCGAFDKCTCYAGYTEADCSSRKCEEGKSWADIADTTVTGREPHYYEECSGKGTCDREKGVCECLEGFEGKSCNRLACAEGCSGHGVCQLMEDANTGYLLWDKDMIQVCSCDKGWSGIDCSSRSCKLGDDPLTSLNLAGTNLEVDEIQNHKLKFVADTPDALSTFIIGYTDWRGEVWWTHAIPYPPTAISVKEGLEALPNNVIPSVEVAITTTSANEIDVAVTFSDTSTKGDQPLLQWGVAGCILDGCQPVYFGLKQDNDGTVANSVDQGSTEGTAERIECSGRGVCDSEFGLCGCFDGYYGDSCDRQTIIM